MSCLTHFILGLLQVSPKSTMKAFQQFNLGSFWKQTIADLKEHSHHQALWNYSAGSCFWCILHMADLFSDTAPLLLYTDLFVYDKSFWRCQLKSLFKKRNKSLAYLHTCVSALDIVHILMYSQLIIEIYTTHLARWAGHLLLTVESANCNQTQTMGLLLLCPWN